MLKIGILGAARIAPWSIIEPARRREDVEIRAVAALRPGKAKEFAEVHGIPVAYEGYDVMIGDPDIDVIYNSLLPNAHAAYSIKALEAGKHVLCEKPFAMNVDEACAMNDAAKSNGKRIIEAFHDRYHPVFKYVLDLKASGRLGKIKTLRAVFNHTIAYSDDEFRHQPRMGGGGLDGPWMLSNSLVSKFHGRRTHY